MPDFLVVLPNSSDASFVEVKYRLNIASQQSLQALSVELHERYSNFIANDLPIYFYLVTNVAPFVYVMKAQSNIYREATGGFYPVSDTALDKFPFFRGDTTHSSFNNVYKESIRPSIIDIMS